MADFFISASTSETQGLTYLEAIAAGTRVLACDNPYLERLIDDPEFGRLFANETEIGKTICTALSEWTPIQLDRFNDKLYEISAENFAKQVYLFYLDVLKHHLMKDALHLRKILFQNQLQSILHQKELKAHPQYH